MNKALCVTTGILRTNEDGTPAPFRETLSFLKKAGFTEIDFDITTPMMLKDEWKEDFRTKLKEAAEAGVRVRYVHLPFDYPNKNTGYDWDQFYTASCRAIDMAVESGADCAVIHPRSFMKRDYDAEAEHEEALRFLEPYRNYAGKAGLTLALENMRGPGRSADACIQRYCTQVCDLIRLADELDMGICWDTGHANISAQGQLQSLLQIGHRLKEVHINDNYAEDDIHIAPFLGSVDWHEVAQGLKEIGYGGSLNLEVGCSRLPGGLRKAYADYMASSARLLADMIV